MEKQRQTTEGASTVLLVDEDPAIGDGLRTLLSNYDLQVRWAPNSAALWSDMELDQGLCLICAEALPDGSGIEVFCELRRREFSIPFALLVSGVDHRAVSNAIALGIEHIIRKPQVHHQLVKFIEQSRTARRVNPASPAPKRS